MSNHNQLVNPVDCKQRHKLPSLIGNSFGDYNCYYCQKRCKWIVTTKLMFEAAECSSQLQALLWMQLHTDKVSK